MKKGNNYDREIKELLNTKKIKEKIELLQNQEVEMKRDLRGGLRPENHILTLKMKDGSNINIPISGKIPDWVWGWHGEVNAYTNGKIKELNKKGSKK